MIDRRRGVADPFEDGFIIHVIHCLARRIFLDDHAADRFRPAYGTGDPDTGDDRVAIGLRRQIVRMDRHIIVRR